MNMLMEESIQEGNVPVETTNNGDSTMMWHLKLGHIYETELKIILDQKLFFGLKMINLSFCEYWITSKQN